MKLIILAACLLATPVLAQQASPGPDPAQAALGDEVMECVSAKIQFRARIRQLETENVRLRQPTPATPEKVPAP